MYLCWAELFEIELFYMRNWIVWNITVLFWIFKLSTSARLSCLKQNYFLYWNCILLLNWIAWNRTVYMYNNGLGINNLQWLIWHKTEPIQSNFVALISRILFIFIESLLWDKNIVYLVKLLLLCNYILEMPVALFVHDYVIKWKVIVWISKWKQEVYFRYSRFSVLIL